MGGDAFTDQQGSRHQGRADASAILRDASMLRPAKLGM
jgi:hypothetical protein